MRLSNLKFSLNDLKLLKSSSKRKEALRKYSPLAYAVASLFHVVNAGVMKYQKPSQQTRDSLTKAATACTKIVNSVIYGDLAIDAWGNKDSYDFFGRISEPFLNLFSSLRNYHLLRGISSSLTQLHIVNKNYLHPNEKNDGKNMWQNFLQNINITKDQVTELFTNTKAGKYSPKDHLLVVPSLIQMLSSGVAIINGSRRNLVDKVAGTLRNAAGFFCDIGLLLRKNPTERNIGVFFGLHAIGDTIKRFLSKENEEMIDNLIMPLFNAGMYYFGKITYEKPEPKEIQETELIDE